VIDGLSNPNPVCRDDPQVVAHHFGNFFWQSLDPLHEPAMNFLEAALRKFAILRVSRRTDLRNRSAFSCAINGQRRGGFSFALKQERLRRKLTSAERRKNIAAAKAHRSVPIATGLLDAIQGMATDL